MTPEEEKSADPKGKYILLGVTDTYHMFKDRTQIETAILLKVYHSPIYVPSKKELLKTKREQQDAGSEDCTEGDGSWKNKANYGQPVFGSRHK